MRTATFPAVRTTPVMRDLAESSLNSGETLSQFIEDSLRRNIELRLSDKAFVARAMQARDVAKQSGQYATVADTMNKLREIQASTSKSLNAKQ